MGGPGGATTSAARVPALRSGSISSSSWTNPKSGLPKVLACSADSLHGADLFGASRSCLSCLSPQWGRRPSRSSPEVLCCRQVVGGWYGSRRCRGRGHAASTDQLTNGCTHRSRPASGARQHKGVRPACWSKAARPPVRAQRSGVVAVAGGCHHPTDLSAEKGVVSGLAGKADPGRDRHERHAMWRSITEVRGTGQS